MDSLTALGLSEKEQELYELLVARPPMPLCELVSLTGLADAEETLAALERLGLVTVAQGRVIVTPPEVALESLALNRTRELAAVRRRMIELSVRFHRGSTPVPADSDADFELISGPDATLRAFETLQRSAVSEIRGFDAPPYFDVPTVGNSTQEELLGKGIRYRILYDRRGIDLPGRPAAMAKLAALGEEARVTDLPIKMALTDESAALLLLGDDLSTTMVVRHRAVVSALSALFELHWQRAVPLNVTPSAADLELLPLLVSGLQDKEIAAHLGWADRTVRRRLHDLLNRLGARTRIQAGHLAVEQGWLE